MKNMDEKKRNLLAGVVGVLIFFLGYYLGYQKLTAKNEELDAKIGTQSAYLSQLREYNDNLRKYEQGIADSKAFITENLAKLPFGVKEEDFLAYMMTLNNAVGSDMTSISYGVPVMVRQFECIIDDKVQTVTAYSTSITTSGTMNYAQLKQYLQFVYEKTGDLTVIDNVSATYDAGKATLSTVIGLTKYYIECESGDYVPVPLPKVNFGVADPFATNSRPTE